VAEIDSTELGSRPLAEVEGITSHQAEMLAGACITTASQLLAADRETLLAIPGMGEKTLDKIIEAAKAQA